MNVPHKHIHRDLLARAIVANLPPNAAVSNPIIKPIPIDFSHTSDDGRILTNVIGIYGPTSIAAEVRGTVRGLLQNDSYSLQYGTSPGQYYSLSDLSGPRQKTAIGLHQKRIATQTTVNLFQLKLHDHEEDISPDVCTHLLFCSHKSCQLINSKKIYYRPTSHMNTRLHLQASPTLPTETTTLFYKSTQRNNMYTEFTRLYMLWIHLLTASISSSTLTSTTRSHPRPENI